MSLETLKLDIELATFSSENASVSTIFAFETVFSGQWEMASNNTINAGILADHIYYNLDTERLKHTKIY